jgi:hypothetical protein
MPGDEPGAAGSVVKRIEAMATSVVMPKKPRSGCSSVLAHEYVPKKVTRRQQPRQRG